MKISERKRPTLTKKPDADKIEKKPKPTKNGNSGGTLKKLDRSKISKEAREKSDKNESKVADRFKDAWFGGDDKKSDKSISNKDKVESGKSISNKESDLDPADNPESFETGTLDYYKEREQDFKDRNPGAEVPDYYSEYGDRYVNEFNELSPELSEDGQEWVTDTRVNLQEAFEDRIADDPKAFAELERDPEKLREWAFDSHSDAYLDAGFADLPADDIVKIATTPRFEDFFSNDALKEAVEVGVQALVDNPSLAAEIPPAALRRVGELAKDGAINLAENVVDGISDLANGVTDFAGDVVDGASDAAGAVVDGVGGAADKVLGAFGL
ncbi:MAG: hypothetical protein KC800_13185 [Candidatus Eremiobacteraeota bacterium]|nr:hypothetical protein [Candidatus Eremiobacteraeota bacterium]